jgi:hypothetical protein
MKICVNCFSNPIIINRVNNINDISDCSYCENNDLPVLDLNNRNNEDLIFRLKIDFGFLDKNENGFSLQNFFTKQINFLSPDLQRDTINNIIYDLFQKDTEFNYSASFRRSKSYIDTTSNYVIDWEDFKHTIKHSNRFGFDISPTLKDAIITILNKNTAIIKNGFSLYRARIGCENELTPFTGDKIGAPPREYATEGRANPRGIPYLYMASHLETALAEVRPEVANKVSVGEFRLNRDLNIVRLQDQSFFEIDSYLEQIRLYLLNFVLHSEFAEPIASDSKYFEYIPTQFVAELAKHIGIDGFEYKSTLTTGTNYCFFNPEDLSYVDGSGRLLKITESNVSFSNVTFAHDL